MEIKSRCKQKPQLSSMILKTFSGRTFSTKLDMYKKNCQEEQGVKEPMSASLPQYKNASQEGQKEYAQEAPAQIGNSSGQNEEGRPYFGRSFTVEFFNNFNWGSEEKK